MAPPIIGTNSGRDWIDLIFDTPVAMFGGGLSYVRFEGVEHIDDPFLGLTPTISAFDADGNLIAAFNLFWEAPIVTPGEIDAFLFRAIDGEGALIERFRLQGSDIVMAATGGGSEPPAPPVIPEPATWAMMIAGLGLVGFAARRRRTLAAA